MDVGSERVKIFQRREVGANFALVEKITREETEEVVHEADDGGAVRDRVCSCDYDVYVVIEGVVEDKQPGEVGVVEVTSRAVPEVVAHPSINVNVMLINEGVRGVNQGGKRIAGEIVCV